MVEGPDGQPVVDLTPMRAWQHGRYSVTVTESSSSPTMRMEHFQQLLDAAKEGLPIRPERIIGASNLPDKDEIIAEMKQDQQAQAQAAMPQGQPMPQQGQLPAGPA